MALLEKVQQMKRERNETSVPEATYFRNLCQTAGVALLAVDRELRVCYHNRRAAELFQLPEGGHADVTLEQFVDADRREELKDLFRRTMQQGQTAEFEYRYQDRHKRVRFLAVSIAPVRDDDGECVG